MPSDARFASGATQSKAIGAAALGALVLGAGAVARTTGTMRNETMRHAIVFALAIFLSMTKAFGQDTTTVIHEGIVDAPLGQVWKAWATPEGLQSWMAPHARIEMRIGGLMQANYDKDGTLGDAKTIENVVLSFEPERMISIKVSKPPERFPFPTAIKAMWTVIYFEPVDDEHTKVRVVSMGFDESEESQKMRAFFRQGNAMTLAALQKQYSKGAK
jgi:uncharacterized protein YndB with AHSA1/START domain